MRPFVGFVKVTVLKDSLRATDVLRARSTPRSAHIDSQDLLSFWASLREWPSQPNSRA